jgi:hypothetical protein
MSFHPSSYQLRSQIAFFLHIPSLHTFVLPRISYRKILIANRHFRLIIINFIFRTDIVADCKSTIQFLQLGVRHTRVLLCNCSDQVVYKWRLLLNGLLCCSGSVAIFLLYEMVMTLGTEFYCLITQGVVVISYRLFGTKYRLTCRTKYPVFYHFSLLEKIHSKTFSVIKDVSNSLSQNVSKKLPQLFV